MRLSLKIAILITAIVCIFSFMMAMFSSFGHTTPQTPTGVVLSVTTTPDSKTFVGFGVISPEIRYTDCGVILLPPGNSGVDSSAQAKLWKVGESVMFDYNSSIQVDLYPPQPAGLVGLYGNANNSLIINCSSFGKIPEGKWTLYLISLSTTYPIACATWYQNETPSMNLSLPFSRVGHANPMQDYGFNQPPGFGEGFFDNGPFWLSVFQISSVVLFALIIVQVIIIVQDRGRKVR